MAQVQTESSEAARGAISDPDAEARGLFRAGRDAYNDARYEQALELFRRAYELSRRPALLYNVGQAADRLRRDDEAIEAFEAYLAALPEAENRLEVETRLAVLRRHQAETAAARNSARGSSTGSADGNDDGIVVAVVIGAVSALLLGGAIALGAALYDPGTMPAPAGDIGPEGVVAALARF